jgi:chemotaxis protein methyltransferase CheR
MSEKGVAPYTGLEELEAELLLEGLRNYYGYDFRNYERAAVRSRIRECMMSARISTISRFQEKVLRDPALLERFLRAFSKPAPSMFSDPRFYAVFRTKVIPLLRTYPFIRIWHVGCSTGQEVYSLAILLEEEGIYERSRIYATDLSEEAIRQARRGIFPASAIESYAANYLEAGGNGSFSRHANAKRGRLVIDPALKRHIVFSQHNLATDGSFNEFQVIICRDLLASFNRTLKDRVDKLTYDSLCRLGVLALGAGESMESMPHEACYSVLDQASRLFQKLGCPFDSITASVEQKPKPVAEVR